MLTAFSEFINAINIWDLAFFAGVVAYVYWFLCVRRIATYRLGVNFFAEVLAWESLEKQRSVAARGWVTAAEWFWMKRRFSKTIQKELTLP